jgi:hypothetical protein
MKKIMILIALLLGYSFNAEAQVTSQTWAISAADDTLVSADTGYAYSLSITGKYDMGITLVNTKTGSGTIGGYAVLQGSYTGGASGTWYTIGSSTTTAKSGEFTTDTVTLANATTTYDPWLIKAEDAIYPYYRAILRTTGGNSVPVITQKLYMRKP